MGERVGERGRWGGRKGGSRSIEPYLENKNPTLRMAFNNIQQTAFKAKVGG